MPKDNQKEVSSKTDPKNALKNNWKYNGVEFNEEIGGIYETPFRGYDPSLGRFMHVDPVIHHTMSPYVGFDNNPIFYADPLGADSESTQDLLQKAWDGTEEGGVSEWVNTENGIQRVPVSSREQHSSVAYDKFSSQSELFRTFIGESKSNRKKSKKKNNNKQSNCGGEGQPPCPESKSKEDEKSTASAEIMEYIKNIGIGLGIFGAPILPKAIVPRFLMGRHILGAKGVTSMSSVFFRNVIPSSLPTVSFLPRAVSLGGQLGRAAGPVGLYISVFAHGIENYLKSSPEEKINANYYTPGGGVVTPSLVTLKKDKG